MKASLPKRRAKPAVGGTALLLTTLAACASTAADSVARASPYFVSRSATQPPRYVVEQRTSHPKRAQAIRQPRGTVFLRAAAGKEKVSGISGSATSRDHTDAALVELGFEGVGRLLGAGLRVAGFQTNDDLLENYTGFDTSGDGTSLFAHLTICPHSDSFRMPIRIGPALITHSVQTKGGYLTGIRDLDWRSVGGAVEVEPEIDLFRTQSSALSIYGRAHFGAGVAEVSNSFADSDTASTTVAGELGLRWQLAKFLIAGGYMINVTSYDKSDCENLCVDESSWTFDGIFLSVGVRW